VNENVKYYIVLAVLAVVLISIGNLSSTAPFLVFAFLASIIVAFITFQKPRHGLVILVFSMLLSPEIGLADVPGHAVSLRIDDILIVIAFIAWLAYTAVDKDWKGFVKTPLDNPLIFLLVLYVASTAINMMFGNVKPVKGFFYCLKYIEYIILYWMTCNIIATDKDVTKYLIAALITCIIVTLFAYSLIGTQPRVYAPFDKIGGEPASLGGYYLVIYPVLFAFLLHSETIIQRIFFSGLILFLLPTFIMTQSRASYLAFVPMLTTMFIFSKKGRALLAISSILGVLLFPIVFPTLYSTMMLRVGDTFTAGHGEQFHEVGIGGKTITDQSALERIESWKLVMSNRYFSKNLMTIFFGNGVTGIGFKEGQFFLLIGELGIFGVLAFYWTLIKITSYSYKAYNAVSSMELKSLSMGLMCCVVALIFQSLTTNTFIIVRIMEPFWFLSAIVMTAWENSAGEEKLLSSVKTA
jgi:hypothetical protein